MCEQSYLAEVRRALFVRGVWGVEARRIIEQLADHCHTMIHDLCADGMTQTEAERVTFAALGDAEVVAESAAIDMRSRRLMARHPWLLAGGGVFLAMLACWIVLIVAVFWGSGLAAAYGWEFVPANAPDARHVPKVNYSVLQVGTMLINWGPLLIGCAFLGWWARRSPGSWKALFIASIAVGMGASAFFSHTDSYYVGIYTRGWAAVIGQIAQLSSETFCRMLGADAPPWSKFLPIVFGGWTLFQLLLPVTSVLLMRYLIPKLNPA